MERHGDIIALRKEQIAEYKRLHAAVWPEVLATIKGCHIQNYSIFLRQLPDGEYYLFSYFEYVGDDFAADCAKMAADPKTQEWWDVCKPCQKKLSDAAEEEWWSPMEEVFHCD